MNSVNCQKFNQLNINIMKKSLFKKSLVLLMIMMGGIFGLRAQTVIFSEDFSGFVDSTTTDLSNTLDTYTSVPGWTGNKVNQSYGKVKVGASSSKGWLQTPTIDLSGNGGYFTLEFDAEAWYHDSTTIIVYVGTTSYQVTGLDNSGNYGTYGHFSLSLSGGTSNSYIRFEGKQASKARFFLDNVVISQNNEEQIAAQPTFSVPSGNYTSPFSLTITSTTDNASIYYTTDGSTPSTSSTLYTSPITINQTTTVKAIAIAEGYTNSSVATATYTFPLTSIAEFKALTDMSQPYQIGNDVTFVFRSGNYTYVKDATAGLLLYGSNSIANDFSEGDQIANLVGKKYVHNNQIEMTNFSYEHSTAPNTGAVVPTLLTISELKANYNNYDAQLITLENVTFPNGFTGSNSTIITQGSDSLTLYKRFSLDTTITAGSTLNLTGFAAKYNSTIQIYPRYNQDFAAPVLVLDAPVITATGEEAEGDNTFYFNATITMTADSNAAIYYTTDGTGPTETSTLYTTPFQITTTSTIKAIAVMENYTNSDVATLDVTITAPTVEAPVFTPEAGTYPDSVTVSMACVTEGAAIRYTIDGTEPTETSTLYSTPMMLDTTTTIKAKAFKADWFASETATALYTIVYEPVMTVDVTALNFTSTQLTQTFTVSGAHLTEAITITCDDTHFTLNPTTITNPNNNTVVTVVFDGTEPATGTVAVACGTHTAQVALTATAQLTAPVLTPATAEDTLVTVTMSCTVADAAIHYTLDGTEPTEQSAVYSTPIVLNTPGTYTVKAIATKTGWEASAVTTGNYIINEPPAPDTVSTPVITPATDTYYAPQTVTITCADADAVIRYTTDGTEPTEASALYSQSFTVNATTTIMAKAWKTDMVPSATATVTISFPDQVATIAAFKAAAATGVEKQIMSDVTFVFRSGRFMFVEDNTGGLLIYDYNNPVITTTYNEGDVIEGGIFGKYSLYNGMVEMLPTHNANAATGTPVTVTPTDVTAAEVKAQYANVYESKLVHLSNVVFIDDEKFVQNGDTMAIFDRFNSVDVTISAGDQADVTGFVSYSSVHGYQIFPRNNADIDIHPVVVMDTVVTPEIEVYRSGEFYYAHITCATPEATIYYTFDGTDPDENSNVFTSDFPLNLEPYTLKAIAMKEGMVNSEIAVYDYNPSGVNTYELRDNLNVYPNPAINDVTISVKNENLSIEKVELYNIYGQLLDKMNVNGSTVEISVSAFATGTYFVKVFTDKGVTTMPVIRK